MNATIFWELIDTAREASAGDQEKQRELLIQSLAQLSESEIFAWEDIFDALMARAYLHSLKMLSLYGSLKQLQDSGNAV